SDFPGDRCGSMLSRISDAVDEKAKADVDLKSVDHVIYLLNYGCPFGGLGDIYGRRVWFPHTQGDFTEGFGWAAIHEIGHNLGLAHAHSYKCNDGLGNPDHGRPAIPVVLNKLEAAYKKDEYGDPFDFMGGGPHGKEPRHNGNYHKLELGVPMQVPTAISDGDYGIDAIEYPTSGAKGWRIEIPWKTGYSSYLEYRTAYGSFGDQFG